MNTTITVSQMVPFLNYAIAHPTSTPLLLRGQPGIAKTSLTRRVAFAHSYTPIILDMSQRDSLDTLGMPYANTEGFTTFASPQWLSRLAEKPHLILFDEIARAQPLVRSSMMELIHERRLDALNFTLPDHTVIVAACNRRSDKAGAADLQTHEKNRFLILDLVVDVDAWTEHEAARGAHPLVRAFFRYRPTLLDQFDPTDDIHCTPRSASALADRMDFILQNPDLALAAVCGHIGEGRAVEFMAFLRLASSLVDYDEIIADPVNCRVPDEPSALYATVCTLAARVTRAHAKPFFTYLKRLPADLAVACVRDADARDKEVLTTREGNEFAVANLKFLRV